MLNACDKYNIDIRLLLSQGLIESHYGTRGLAYHTNSVFNMGTFDGTPLDKILNIHKYIHPNQSIEPYLINLRNSYLGNTKTEQDLLNNFVNLCGKRYASYDKYEKELKIIWDDINSITKLDSLITIYQILKAELGR
jgi:beta-N-acetylglucosaminidase